ncbi:14920_t:CDS:2, partial [Cetraspora pellucida]
IRTRPHHRKTCSQCGAMGHTIRKCPIRPPLVIGNLNNIRKSVKKYFENPSLNLRSCQCCGKISHTQRNCYRRANCISNAQLNEVKKKIDKFKNQYKMNVSRILKIPRRPRIPNYIAACGCCDNENYNHNDLQPIPPNIGIGLQLTPKQPPSISSRPPSPILPRPENNGNNENNNIFHNGM